MLYKERLLKLKKGNTQKDIADIIGISRGRYSHYETEYEIMPLKYLDKICMYYEVSLDYLFNFSNDKNYQSNLKELDLKKSSIRIKEFRKEQKLTQDKLAKELNISRTTIAEYERGTNLIATSFLYTICKKYNISADYLLGKTDYPRSILK